MVKTRFKSRELSLKIDPEMHTAIERAAKKRRVSTSEFIRTTMAAALGMCLACGRHHETRQETAA